MPLQFSNIVGEYNSTEYEDCGFLQVFLPDEPPWESNLEGTCRKTRDKAKMRYNEKKKTRMCVALCAKTIHQGLSKPWPLRTEIEPIVSPLHRRRTTSDVTQSESISANFKTLSLSRYSHHWRVLLPLREIRIRRRRTLTWHAFGPSGFFLVATYFVIGTAATKVKMAQKVAQGVAEKKRGRRGPGSVIGSSAAGCVCAFLTIFGVGGEAFSRLWRLGFVASFCTKLSDTVSSEIGKAYGKTTYLVTTLKVVPRGTEGAVSVEGTLAGILASVVLAFVSFLIGEVGSHEAIICVLAAQIANLGESIIGAALQEKEGFKWLNNDAVNVINISMGSIIAVFMQQALQIWGS